jgi:hypothetical protein
LRANGRRKLCDEGEEGDERTDGSQVTISHKHFGFRRLASSVKGAKA